MKKSKITSREIVVIIVMSLILLTVGYYLFFYFPMNAEMYYLKNETVKAESDIVTAEGQSAKKRAMQEELEEIFARPEDEITEIAIFDNKEVVLNMLYGILGRTDNYSLTFQDPDIQKDGTVRRNVSMSFTCDNYELTKAVIEDLANCNWRCLVKNLSLKCDGDLMKTPVTVSVEITFFERTEPEETEPAETTEPVGPAAREPAQAA